jgi:hypothetical protein
MFVLFDQLQENSCKFYTALSLIFMTVLVHFAASFAISFLKFVSLFTFDIK